MGRYIFYLMVGIFLWCSPSFGEKESYFYKMTDPSTIKSIKCKKLVEAIMNYIDKNGLEKAIEEVNKKDGLFSNVAEKGEQYAAIYSFDGTVLAHTIFPGMHGKNALGFKDAFGKNIILEDFTIAENGGGFIQIGYYNPMTHKTEPKKVYISPKIITKERPEGIFIGSGFYYQESHVFPLQTPNLSSYLGTDQKDVSK